MKLKSMSGKSRKYTSLIEPIQLHFVTWALPLIPKKIETYHLTLLTIPLSLILVIGAKIFVGNPWFLVFHAFIIFTQYISDILDGALGRYRNTGLIRWGFYMDHLFDYVFANAIVLSYSIYFQINVELTAIIIAVIGAFFSQEFIIGNIKGMINTSGYYGLGPSEVRFGVIFLDLILAFSKYIPSEQTLTVVVALIIITFSATSWVTQKSLWKQDMKSKN
ncbi:hypothetical protein KKH50_00125 [Patescibacteria group bacterium]|nr:hypothetical protein [Patescibacteria group bacterium]